MFILKCCSMWTIKCETCMGSYTHYMKKYKLKDLLTSILVMTWFKLFEVVERFVTFQIVWSCRKVYDCNLNQFLEKNTNNKLFDLCWMII